MPNIDAVSFNYYTISLLIGGFTALISGFLVFAQNRKRGENQAWLALTISTALWSFGYLSMTVAETHRAAYISNLVLHYAAIFIPLFYFLLVLTITGTLKRYRRLFWLFALMAFWFVFINPSPRFIADVAPKVGFNFAPVPGDLYIYFFAYFCGLVLTGLIVTGMTILRTKERVERLRLFYTMLFTVAASVGGGSVFATTFSSDIAPYPLILFSVYPAISAFAILRFQLFDAKVIATQMVTYGIWTFILIRILIAESRPERFANTLLLIGTIFLGWFLIKSVKKEVATRERIEKLAKELAAANDRLKELDELKSEFVSLATHQIRGPLAAIKGYASMLLEGDFGGGLPEPFREPVKTIFDSSSALAGVVQDFLDVSRIEQGRMKYELKVFDLSALAQTVAEEFVQNIERKGLRLKLEIEPHIMTYADTGKLRQVIENLIDNASKYTLRGSITVRVGQQSGKARIEVRDTGIGIPKETLPQLFKKFSRASDASKTNIKGTGLGLYVAKELIEAQGGRIWAESEGEGKGAAFLVELPLAS